ncbi:hypothetical protein ACFOUP_04065 [Belliella kenyensis]|uniref:Lipoprotein n=1 Tax=Belliella kenyensis TaxID=1472724 RepID=A0ABV8EJ55_9BACT|nr:hypothetical protein [Belliella kenyensis]MCH7403083.1 hypothetical protein [Belliella kenyensis]MDN3602252.1 hypothetical protein [Belliella kenyensis]
MGKLKNGIIKISLILGLAMIGGGCLQEPNLEIQCVEGIIPKDILYRLIHEECFSNSLWIEILNSDELGKDVNIYTPSPGGQPNSPIQYKNIVEIPFSSLFIESNQLDSLLGGKIYFNYRIATENEINAIRNTGCTEVYDSYEIPVLIITDLSFNGCPQTSDF